MKNLVIYLEYANVSFHNLLQRFTDTWPKRAIVTINACLLSHLTPVLLTLFRHLFDINVFITTETSFVISV